MARIQLAAEQYGYACDRQGNARAGVLAAWDTPVYAASTGATVVAPAAILTDVNGLLPGWIEPGRWTRTVGGVPMVVQAVDATILRPITTTVDGADPTGHTSSLEQFRAAVDGASAAGRTLYVPDGTYLFTINSAADSIILPSNFRIVFSERATVKWGRQGVYYPPFVIVGKTDVRIENLTLLWTGALTYGPGLDFLYDNDDGPSIDVDSNRYGAVNAYANRDYCSGVFIVESSKITVTNFRGSSVAQNSTSVIHAWVFASRVDDLTVDVAYVDDCCLGVLTGGNSRGRIANITGGRLSQDVGIPGHIVYTFMSDVTVENINDLGIESGANAAKQIGHSVSSKGVSQVIIRGITSRRACGPLNVQGTLGCSISDIVWTSNASVATVSAAPKLYLVTSAPPLQVVGTNIVLTQTRDDGELFGGATNGGRFTNMTLKRTDNAPATSGYFQLKGVGNKIEATLVQGGSEPAPIVDDWNGTAQRNVFELALSGWTTYPVIDLSRADVLYNEFVFDPMWSPSALTPQRWYGVPLGDHELIWRNYSSWSALMSNVARFADGPIVYSKVVAAGSTTWTKKFPIPYGQWIVTAAITAGVSDLVQRDGTYLVTMAKRPLAAVGFANIQLLGAVAANGSGLAAQTATVSSEGSGTFGITFNLPDTTDNPASIVFSAQRIGH